jgi:hypothetical protein
MKKIAILLATVATLAAVASAPAEARVRRGINPVVASSVLAGAVVAAAAADQYGYGRGYYYGPRYYDGPVVYTGGWRRGWGW